MLLTVCIDNSFISCGAFDGDRLRFVTSMATLPRRTADQYAVELESLLRLHGALPTDFGEAALASVVPELIPIFSEAIQTLTGCAALVLGPGVKTGLNILIENPAQLGGDLVAAAVAAAARFPLPCVLFDFGSVTTVSVLDKNGSYRGAIISAGVGLTLDALTSHTALLPHIGIGSPPSVIGKNSVQSMQSGVIFGTAAMLDGLAERIEAELKSAVHIVASGQFAEAILPHCRRKAELCEHLPLHGLRIIFAKNHAIAV